MWAVRTWHTNKRLTDESKFSRSRSSSFVLDSLLVFFVVQQRSHTDIHLYIITCSHDKCGSLSSFRSVSLQYGKLESSLLCHLTPQVSQLVASNSPIKSSNKAGKEQLHSNVTNKQSNQISSDSQENKLWEGNYTDLKMSSFLAWNWNKYFLH